MKLYIAFQLDSSGLEWLTFWHDNPPAASSGAVVNGFLYGFLIVPG
jgi:hypothetical protein